MPTTNNPEIFDEREASAPAGAKVIYADRIVNFGVGASVSRLTLAMEVKSDSYEPFAQIVMPTPALLEALEFIARTITTDENLAKGIITGLDAFREKLATIGK